MHGGILVQVSSIQNVKLHSEKVSVHPTLKRLCLKDLDIGIRDIMTEINVNLTI